MPKKRITIKDDDDRHVIKDRRNRSRPRQKEDEMEGEGLGNLTPSSAEMYKKKKNAKITSIQLFRRPVEDALTGVMDLFTGNAVSKYFKSTSHDKLFHLGLIINGKWLYHKQANIAIESMPNGFRKGKKIELKPVTGFSSDLTFKDMYRRTREKVGEKKFYDYDSFKNNCQDFILDTLDTIGADYDREWVKQDVEKIVEKSPLWFPDLAKALTDTASVAEKIVGAGYSDSEDDDTEEIQRKDQEERDKREEKNIKKKPKKTKPLDLESNPKFRRRRREDDDEDPPAPRPMIGRSVNFH